LSATDEVVKSKPQIKYCLDSYDRFYRAKINRYSPLSQSSKREYQAVVGTVERVNRG